MISPLKQRSLGRWVMADGYCSNCRTMTSHWVDSDGILCRRCHKAFQRAEARAIRESKEDDERCRIRMDNLIKSKYYLDHEFTHRNYSDQGRYRHRCERYSNHTFWSDSEYASGLCASCSREMDRLEKEAEALWRKNKERYFRRMRRVYKSFGLDTGTWDESRIGPWKSVW